MKQAEQQFEATCLGVALLERRLEQLKEQGLPYHECSQALQRMQIRLAALRSEIALQEQAVRAVRPPSIPP